MNTPKISVLIPLYNHKHYIEQCINSVLIQTFQDFEIIVRDDGSSDGSADFVEEKYAAEIKSGKIKLRRNEKNIGEFPTDNLLLREAAGKYVMILHSDDLYLPHALEHMYKIAEEYQADVVHAPIYFTSNSDGIIEEGTRLTLTHIKGLKISYNQRHMNKIDLISDEPTKRFEDWITINIDAQNNIFNRKFLLENDISFTSFGTGLTGGNRLFALKWIMKAKVFVKTFRPFYIRRDAPDSITRSDFLPEHVAQFISEEIELSRYLDKFFAESEFFKDKPDVQYRARNYFLATVDNSFIKRNGVYKEGISPELNEAVENVFKKYFGDDFAYPTFLFHWVHCNMHKQKVSLLIAPPNQIDS